MFVVSFHFIFYVHTVSQKTAEQMHFLYFYVSHGSATKFLGVGEKYYIYFVDNLLLLSTVKEFSKSVTFDEVIAKIRHHVF